MRYKKEGQKYTFSVATSVQWHILPWGEFGPHLACQQWLGGCTSGDKTSGLSQRKPAFISLSDHLDICSSDWLILMKEQLQNVVCLCSIPSSAPDYFSFTLFPSDLKKGGKIPKGLRRDFIWVHPVRGDSNPKRLSWDSSLVAETAENVPHQALETMGCSFNWEQSFFKEKQPKQRFF